MDGQLHLLTSYASVPGSDVGHDSGRDNVDSWYVGFRLNGYSSSRLKGLAANLRLDGWCKVQFPR